MLLLMLLGCWSSPNPAPPPVKPNVVLIVVDTLRRDHLGIYGHTRDTSPNIDALARAGTRYERAYSQAPWTTPSIGSMLTSRFPTELGVETERVALPEQVVLLPEWLEQHGYDTAAIVSHNYCGKEWGFGQGFDQFDQSSVSDDIPIRGDLVSDAALAFLEREHDRPYFLWLHYFDPHSNFYSHEGFTYETDPAYAGPITSGMKWVDILAQRDTLTPADLDRIRDLYDSEIAYTDFQIGRVLDQLRQSGQLDDTLILFTADHGEEFGDHNRLGHGHALWNELVQVPLIVHYPKGAHGGVVHSPAALLDLYPTVLDVLGLPAPPDIAGTSLLSGGSTSIYTETRRARFRQQALVEGDFKYIHNRRNDGAVMFNVAQDPKESRNLARRDKVSKVKTAMQTRLDHWNTTQTPQWDKRTVELSEEQEASLKALGYLE